MSFRVIIVALTCSDRSGSYRVLKCVPNFSAHPLITFIQLNFLTKVWFPWTVCIFHKHIHILFYNVIEKYLAHFILDGKIEHLILLFIISVGPPRAG